jgi:hypothetical protein
MSQWCWIACILAVTIFLLGSTTVAAQKKEEWGIVLVDFRLNNSELFGRTVKQLQRFQQLSPHVPIELWVHTGMKLPSSFNKQVTLKYLDLPRDPLPSRPHLPLYGYISKAFALLETSFQTGIFFDSDVLFCSGWEPKVDKLLADFPDSKVIWTNETNFGAFGGRNNTYYTPSVGEELAEYQNYFERNTGTIVAIRKGVVTNKFLKEEIFLWKKHDEKQISSTDQGAFREAGFIHRHHTKEHLADPMIFCREPRDNSFSTPDCDCRNCAVVHLAATFDHCIDKFLAQN